MIPLVLSCNVTFSTYTQFPMSAYTAQTSNKWTSMAYALASVALIGTGVTMMMSAGGAPTTQAFAQTVGQAVHARPVVAPVMPGYQQSVGAAAAVGAPARYSTNVEAYNTDAVQDVVTTIPAVPARSSGAALLATFAAAVAAMAAAAFYQQRRATRSAQALKPAFMEFGGEEQIALCYTTGQRTGRKSTAVYGLFDRVGRLVRSNVTAVVKKLEDPEKVLLN